MSDLYDPRHPQLPPGIFDPVTASDPDLEKYGFPPRPDPALLESRALWEETVSQPLEYVESKFVDEIYPGVLLSPTWSGAILKSSSPQSPLRPPPFKGFRSISSYWIIPNAYPPYDCTPPVGSPQSNYRCYTFVAFDGWQDNSGDPPALILGTKSESESHTATVFVQIDGKEIDLSLPVMPGDLVTAHLWVLAIPGRFGIFVVNRNTGKATRATFNLPRDFKGKTAEWIVARQNIDYGYVGKATEILPNYGATFFHKTCAWGNGHEFTVDQGQLIDMVASPQVYPRDSKYYGQIISTAEHIRKNILLVYAYDNEGRTKVPRGLPGPGSRP